MKQFFISFLFSILFFIANAQLKTNVNISYKHSNGTYSEYYFREVQFRTGSALNKATETQNYDKDADYALVWFGQSEVAIIKLDDQILSGLSRYLSDIDKVTFDLYCNLHRNLLTGSDQDRTVWKICTLPNSISNLCP